MSNPMRDISNLGGDGNYYHMAHKIENLNKRIEENEYHCMDIHLAYKNEFKKINNEIVLQKQVNVKVNNELMRIIEILSKNVIEQNTEINKIKHINTMMDRRIEHMEQFVKYDYNAIANKNLILHKEYNKIYQSIAIRIARQHPALYHYNYERMQLQKKELHTEFRLVYRYIAKQKALLLKLMIF